MTQTINRRRALAVFGSVSLGSVLAACGADGDGTSVVTTEDGATTTVQSKTTTPAGTAELFEKSASCSLTAQATEGPYYFDVDSIRSDIREDREGTLLRLGIRVRDAKSCKAIENAVVDIWHCDAVGVYSGFESASTGAGGGTPGGGPGGGNGGPTDDQTFLRGAQVTNADGIVEFRTIYPGSYTGRTVHIHAKVHLDRTTVLTTQLFFDEEVTETVYSRTPYSEGAGRDTFNDADNIFNPALMLTQSAQGDAQLGVITFDVEPA